MMTKKSSEEGTYEKVGSQLPCNATARALHLLSLTALHISSASGTAPVALCEFELVALPSIPWMSSSGQVVSADVTGRFAPLQAFEETYRREFGFVLENRSIIVDDVRVRAMGKVSKRLLMSSRSNY